MKNKTIRLLVTGVVFLIFTVIDVYINTENKLEAGMITYIGFFIVMHVIAIESILSKDKLLSYILWVIVVLISLLVAIKFSFKEWYAGIITLVFLYLYFSLLLRFFRMEFTYSNDKNNE